MKLCKCLLLLLALALGAAGGAEAEIAPQIRAFDGKRIGVLTGSIGAEILKEKLPTARALYIDNYANMVNDLNAGKIEAILEDDFVVLALEHDNSNFKHIDEYLRTFDKAFIFTKSPEGDKIRTEFNEFLRTLKTDGTLKQISDVWIGFDESKKTLPDYEKYPAANGTIKFAVDNTTPTFSYVKDGKIVGYDVDLLARFCKAYGYRPEASAMNFSGELSAVHSGRCLVGISAIAITPERAETVNFSESVYTGGAMLLVKRTDNGQEASASRAKYTKIADLEGKRIGVQTGTTNDKAASKAIPEVSIEYFDSFADILAALRLGKIDASCLALNAARFILMSNEDLTVLDKPLLELDAAPIFPKTEAGRKLCEQFNGFIKAQWDNGTFKQMDSVWFGQDESKRTVKDYSNLPAPNGTLRMAVDVTLAPFAYVKDNRIVGYEVEMAVKFCEENGYGLEVVPMSFGAIIPAVMSGKCDFASCTIAITAERAEQVLFALPNAKTGNVIVVRKSDAAPQSTENRTGFADMAGKKIGVETGALAAQLVSEQIPSAQIEYFEALTDALVALKLGKIDALACTVLAARHMMNENEELEYLDEWLRTADIMPVFTPSDRGRRILEEYSSFIKALWDDGTIDRLYELWLGKDESKKVVIDYSSLPATNGVIRLAVDTAMPPMAYVRDGVVVGYDVDLAARFCEAKGYGLEVVQTNIAGMIAAVQSGKCDMSQSMNYTEERAQSVLFSPVATAHSGNVIVVRKAITEAQAEAPREAEHPSFIDDLKASFNRTFIREDRWQLFVEGIISTMIITVSAIICGTILGFAVYMFCRGGNIIANLITRFFVWLIQGMPMVVLLMILYYVIFGKVDIAGIWVAVIAFSMTFGAAVYGMLCAGVNALDKGQTEAAYALGFSDRRTFFTVILPQAALHFMPSYKAEVVALIKATAIVGYIAVQDLTKMGDIVRSRTYEAFFPLIAVAVIYFVLAGMLNVVVSMIHNSINPEKRTRDDILRGIEMHD